MSESPGVVFVIPSLGTENTQHFHHTLRLAQELSARRPVAVVVERTDGAAIELGLPAAWLANDKLTRLALARALVAFSRQGYRHVYVRTSQAAAVVASLLRPWLGGAVLYWHCGVTEPASLFSRRIYGVVKSELPFRLALRTSSALVTGTPAVADWYAETYHIPRRRIRVLPNDVDVSAVPRQSSATRAAARRRIGLPTDVRLALMVHRLSPMRRSVDYLPYIGRVVAGRRGWALAIVGDGPEFDRARSAVAREGFGAAIRFVGAVPSGEVGDWYAAADAFVLASRAGEGFPRVLIEAMAWSLPIATTDAGGIRDVMPPWAQDAVADRRDPPALATALARIMDDENRDALGKKYRTWVGRYDTSVAVESLDAILRDYDPDFRAARRILLRSRRAFPTRPSDS